MKIVPLNKRSKKEKKAYYKSQRQMNGFNTGQRDMGKTRDEINAATADEEIKKYNY